MAFYITTPIYYVNDAPHIGHAYTTIAADALARFHRARNVHTWMLTGTDEHGEKIEKSAKAKGVPIQEFIDSISGRFRATWERLDIAYDDYIRTTEPRHQKIVERIWKAMTDAGDIYLGAYSGWYCVSCEAFYTESQLKPGKLCPDHEKPVEWVEKESSYFFRLSKYQAPLIAHIKANPDFIRPESRRNEVLGFLENEELRDLSVSRTSFKWGIPVPGDPAHVIYVWIDALTNYASALGGPGAVPYEEFWRDAVHLIGKDILRFHTIYWPAMLMSAGWALPKTILAHGWWTVKGKKISKSMPATKVDPNVLADDIGADALRYFLLREVPLGLDGDFAYEALIGRINSDLANDLGNLLNRTLSIVEKLGGDVPAAGEEPAAVAPLREAAVAAANAAAAHLENLQPSRALEEIWKFVGVTNRVVDTVIQQKIHKEGPVLHALLEAIYWISILVAPVMPKKSIEMQRQLGVAPHIHWPSRWGHELPAGGKVAKGAPLFPRIDEDRQAALLDKWIPPDPNAAPPAPAPTGNGQIEKADFDKLDLRVALVTAAERVPKKDKLLKLQVDLGGESRQIVAGLAAAYAPETLIGKRVVLVANLAPAKIGGVESQGMILAVTSDQKIVGLTGVDRDVPPGTKVS